MSRQAFPISTFYDASGSPLSGGYVLIYLVNDAHAPDGLVCGGMTLQVSLNTSGVMNTVPQVWPVADLEPSGLYYVLRAYTSSGELVSGPSIVEV